MSAGVGSVFRRGKVWWISYYYRGERYRESSKSKRKKDRDSFTQTKAR